MKNRHLPIGKSQSDKMRCCKNYPVHGVIFGLTFAVMDILLFIFGENDVFDMELTQFIFPHLNKEMTIVVTAIIVFLTLFVISFVFDFIIGEYYIIKC